MQTNPIKRANRSARSSGAVGRFPLCYRALRDLTQGQFILDDSSLPKGEVLDFGAGPDAIHTKMLREDGYEVTAYDFGDNVTSEIDAQALTRSYEIVIASNVLNVQEEELIEVTLNQLFDSVKPGGCLLWNYPSSPRYMGLSTRQMIQRVMSLGFVASRRVGGTSSGPVYLCWKSNEPRRGADPASACGDDTHDGST